MNLKITEKYKFILKYTTVYVVVVLMLGSFLGGLAIGGREGREEARKEVFGGVILDKEKLPEYLSKDVDFNLFSIAVKNLLDNGVKYSKDKKIVIKNDFFNSFIDSIISFFVTSIPLFSIKKSMILNIGFPPKNFIKSEFSILLIMSTKT